MAKSFTKQLPILREIKQKVGSGMERVRSLRYPCISKRELINDLETAIKNQAGYACGKIGGGQQPIIYYEIFLKKAINNLEKTQSFEETLHFSALKQICIFPKDLNFYKEYNSFYMEHVKKLDCLGLFYYRHELEIIKHYNLKCKIIYYSNQEPDRSIPADEENCYLKHFRGKKILLISPFANLLKSRATQEIFEGVWSKTGKPWFYPDSVQALEFPYSFLPETQRKYSTSLDLYEDIISEINKRDFDIALISAAGLAIPIASHIKSMGKIGIDLGGHQQVLFGVIGKRWREQEYWKNYFNSYWINMPEEYKPKQLDVCDSGAYW